MVGIVIGAGMVAVGIAALLHHRHCGHRSMLKCALRRLKATDEQKRQIVSLADEAHRRLQVSKERVCALRREVTEIWSAPSVDAQRLEALESQLFEAIGEGTQVMRETFTRVHGILSPEQRNKVADWMRHVHRHHHHHHCAAGACHC
jgi:Spy/CpxP family protein refolding chaperone